MLGQHRYLLSCVTKGFPTSANFEPNLSEMVVGKERDSQILVNLLVTHVPSCNGNNAKTLGLKHLQLPGMRASGGPPDRAHVVHHRTDELLVHHNAIPDGETTSSVEESSQHSRSLCSFLSHLIDMS